MLDTLLYITLAATCLFLYKMLFRKSTELHKAFKIPVSARLISTDLGGKKIGKPLISRGVIGFSDALFMNAKTPYICEYKARRFSGRIRTYEYYQIILYIGIARDRYGVLPIGRLKYKDSLIQVEFDEAVFRELIAIRKEFLSLKSRRSFIKSAPKPLRSRISFNMKFNYV